MVIKTIALYIQSLPKSFSFSLNTIPPHISNTLNSRTSVYVFSISYIDSLYDYLMFFLLDIPFQTRKGVDFYLWCLVLHFHKLGHFYLPVGRYLVAQIANYINKGRNSNNPNKKLSLVWNILIKY